MGEATFHTATDGYPARDAPAWTEEKLMILECYIQAFARLQEGRRLVRLGSVRGHGAQLFAAP